MRLSCARRALLCRTESPLGPGQHTQGRAGQGSATPRVTGRERTVPFLALAEGSSLIQAHPEPFRRLAALALARSPHGAARPGVPRSRRSPVPSVPSAGPPAGRGAAGSARRAAAPSCGPAAPSPGAPSARSSAEPWPPPPVPVRAKAGPRRAHSPPRPPGSPCPPCPAPARPGPPPAPLAPAASHGSAQVTAGFL